ncbi:hypothetical protein COCVIDRAFT_86289 [Bipolaris victoriae FI3]|uniref:Uncharacterized protein n=1 Tax=Bipolaris victoriae (strain FI3) TaxID=930091 RepID=W7EY14_BIPV3|nr:hypothetical protein COCVIDRAFT_86289 [Bipolaris victoriae FI3]
MFSSPSSPHTTTISPDSTRPSPLAASPTLDSLTPVLVRPQLVRHKASNCPSAYVRNSISTPAPPTPLRPASTTPRPRLCRCQVM